MRGEVFLLLCALISCSVGASAKVKTIDEEDNFLYESMAKKAIRKYNKESKEPFRWELDKMLEVNRQLADGIKYSIYMTIVKTNCRNDEDSSADCEHTDVVKKCNAEVKRRIRRHGIQETVIMKNCEEEFTKDLKKFDKRKIELTHDDSITVEDLRKAKIIKPRDYVHWNSFLDFMDRHEKKYTDKREVLKKFRVFKRNLKAVRHMQEAEQGTAVYGITKFSDLTSSQFKKIYLPYQWEQPVYPLREADLQEEGVDVDEEPLENFDWRDHGAVTQVKNQGSCGSCWAFSTTGNVEGAWYLAKKKLVSLSEQQLVDCDTLDQGCNGGLPSNAYKQIIEMGGLEPEDVYPYDAKGETCHITRKDLAVYINDSVEIPHDEKKMQAWLVAKGPISIGLNANTLQFYRHGVTHPWKIFCEPFMLNHGVLIVGYGVDGRKPYWTIKNSWGTNWGEKGYFRLYRGKNVCGVTEMATSAIVKP